MVVNRAHKNNRVFVHKGVYDAYRVGEHLVVHLKARVRLKVEAVNAVCAGWVGRGAPRGTWLKGVGVCLQCELPKGGQHVTELRVFRTQLGRLRRAAVGS